MRLSFRVAIVLITCLVAIALPAMPAQAQDERITPHPGSGYVGEKVYITGTNFTDDDYWVYYESDGGWVEVLDRYDCEVDSDELFRTEDFLTPESSRGDHEIRVCNSHSSSSSYRVAYAYFTVKPEIEIVSPSAAKGAVGTNVTVKGLGFAQNEENVELWYDDEVIEDDIPVDEHGSWECSFRLPPSAQGSHKIDAGGDESRLREVEDATFEVTPRIALDESSGSPGKTVTMTGSGFAAGERGIRILFAGEEVQTEIIRAGPAGNWTQPFRVPEMSKGTYNVTAEGEFTDKEDVSSVSFEIKPGLVLSPDQGHVGTNLTVTGGGFAANKNVDVMYDGSQAATGRTDGEGSFNVTFVVRESPHGSRQVTAEDASGNDAAAIFTMESDRPAVPELISPLDKSRVGFIDKVTPAFEWSEATDESGVRYSLQIAASANVTANGFVTPIVSKEGLVGTNYTLNETEALPYGTYYWIVQAVDRAENKSGWSPARSFQAGLLPLRAFILAIVVIAAVIGTLVYFFVFRRRIHYY